MKKVGCPCSGKEATEAVTDGELPPVSIWGAGMETSGFSMKHRKLSTLPPCLPPGWVWVQHLDSVETRIRAHRPLKFTTQTPQSVSFSETFLLLLNLCYVCAHYCDCICSTRKEWKALVYQHLRVNKRVGTSQKDSVLSSRLPSTLHVGWSHSQVMIPDSWSRNLRMSPSPLSICPACYLSFVISSISDTQNKT